MFLKDCDKTASPLNGKVLCFNPHHHFGVDGNVERANHFERAASLERHSQLKFYSVIMYLRRQQANTWKAHLVGMGTKNSEFAAIPISGWKRFIRLPKWIEERSRSWRKNWSSSEVDDATPAA